MLQIGCALVGRSKSVSKAALSARSENPIVRFNGHALAMGWRYVRYRLEDCNSILRGHERISLVYIPGYVRHDSKARTLGGTTGGVPCAFDGTCARIKFEIAFLRALRASVVNQGFSVK